MKNTRYLQNTVFRLRNNLRYSEQTINSYECELKQFLNYTDKDLLRISKQDIDNYIEWINISGYSVSKQNIFISALIHLFCQTDYVSFRFPVYLRFSFSNSS